MIAGAARFTPVLRFPDYLELDVYATGERMTGVLQVTPHCHVYGRPGCHLCDDAVAIIERVRARLPFALEQRNIEADDGLFKRYLERIPVVEIDGGRASSCSWTSSSSSVA